MVLYVSRNLSSILPIRHADNRGVYPMQYHGADLDQTIFAHAELQDYLINFINTLDPNIAATDSDSDSDSRSTSEKVKLPYWPRYNTKTREILEIADVNGGGDGGVPLSIGKDDYRVAPIQKLIEVGLEHPI